MPRDLRWSEGGGAVSFEGGIPVRAGPTYEAMTTSPAFRVQGYLAHKKQRPPRTVQ